MSADIRKKLADKHTKLTSRLKRTADQREEIDEYPEGTFQVVPTEIIKPNPDQPRQVFNEERMAELSQSIKDKGVLQPLIIQVKGGDDIHLVAGERRFRAAKMAGLKEVPCIVTKGNPAEIALIENLQREDLKPIEEAEALDRMIKEHDYTQEQLSNVIGKARTTITEALSLNKLPKEIKEECRRADNYPRRLLVEIAKQDSPEAMIDLFNQVKEGQLKSDSVRKITRKPRERIQRSPTAIAIDRVMLLSNTLEKYDPNTAKESEKLELITILNELKKLIEGKYL
jgi:ParB family chromosome partitioning protein